jgi:hypothetical protein
METNSLNALPWSASYVERRFPHGAAPESTSMPAALAPAWRLVLGARPPAQQIALERSRAGRHSWWWLAGARAGGRRNEGGEDLDLGVMRRHGARNTVLLRSGTL